MLRFTYIIILAVLVGCSNSPSEGKSITTDLVSSPLSASSKAVKVDVPEIEMEEVEFNFGELVQGESVTHDFILKNVGEGALIISAAKGSCGCTVPQWPKEPIAQGEEAIIKVTFNSVSKQGKQRKTVTLVTNAIPNTKVLTISGNIIVPENK